MMEGSRKTDWLHPEICTIGKLGAEKAFLAEAPCEQKCHSDPFHKK